MAVDVGSHLLIALIEKPGTPNSWSFLTAFTNVLVGGEKKTLMQVFDEIPLVSHVMYIACMVCGEFLVFVVSRM